MTEAVVDGLEVVEVDEHDADRGRATLRPHERVLDAVDEERPVGEARDGVVEGLVRELVLEGLALAHVAAVQDDAADVLVAEQIRVLDLEHQRRSVPMQERAFERVSLLTAGSVSGDQLRVPPGVLQSGGSYISLIRAVRAFGGRFDPQTAPYFNATEYHLADAVTSVFTVP